MQVALGAYHHAPFRDGVARSGVTVQAHSPLGGVKRAGKLSKDAVLARIRGSADVAAVLALVAESQMIELEPLGGKGP